ncbi:DUF2790 domain-containing protein [Pseudomonas petrae]|uniref:DUF2790 domain-containing protein n=1 Tax=Pseudomonas petrae TaxID=2912190 RepID=A0ABS9I2R1_9PSED|nr:DUF2790 domain-containing protein [Pseudomonas petrae]MCF7532493.1 DUF2790 domain-containing protein [Pseudomonas petrae]MCF7536127.1 DUF2790 domain-containing protein [Pseudomonas petrae]MCF7541649.1 DUF2790 domain-containing protein [Pseudomonas petrae]MCF7557493.1 DUF2790 domain-containing protein [Pseudomonas petrae]
MKRILFPAMFFIASLSACAQQAAASPAVVFYSDGLYLDISKGVDIYPIADDWGPTLAEITCKGAEGKIHIPGRIVMLIGCSN